MAEELLGAVLDLHEGDLGMFIAVVDGIEDIFLNSHGLGALDESNLSFPIYLIKHKEGRKGKGQSAVL